MASPIVSTQWLAERLDDPDVKVIDASWYLPQMERDPLAEFRVAHIPGAVHFNIDEIADTSTDLPHMVPDAETFAAAAGAKGISDTDTIVVYDGMGMFSSPRVWWNFRVMGAGNVFVLAGGLPKWQAENRPVETGTEKPEPTVFGARRQSENIASVNDVLAAADAGIQVVDMRPGERFRGEVPEPREGLRAGHIPQSLNLPFPELIADGTLLDDDALRARIASAGIDPEKPLITSCGSGVTATFLNLALAQLGIEAMRVYDGSWTEWGADEDLPVVTG